MRKSSLVSSRIKRNLKGSRSIATVDKNLIKKMVRKCIRLLNKKEYELDLPKDATDIALHRLSIVDKNVNGATYGGRNIIQINLSYWQHCKGYPHYEREYASYDADPTIGGVTVNSLEEALWLTVAHEVSHHIQRRYCPNIRRFRNTHSKPHGDCFKAIYRYLRRDLVNPILKGEA